MLRDDSLVGLVGSTYVTPQPSEPRTLYRASPAYRRDGLSWTAGIGEYPDYYAGPAFTTESVRIWKCTVPPERILAVFIGIEHICDVRGLEIIERDEPIRRVWDPHYYFPRDELRTWKKHH